MSVTIAITGVKELDTALKMMPRALDDKFMTAVNRDRSKPLVQAMKSLSPIGETHNLVNSLGTVKVRKAQELGTVRSGPRQKGGYKGFHAKFIEFGFKTRKGTGKSKGEGKEFVQPKPFIEPAWDATKAQIESGLNDSIAKVLVRTMRRYLK